MATTLVNMVQNKIVTNLDTYNYTTLVSGMHMVKVTINMPAPSGMSITIKNNSSTIATFSSPAAAQSVINLQAVINSTASDVIGIVLASSAALDNQINDFKAEISIHQGSF